MYLQNIKVEDGDEEEEVNTQLDRLLELSDYYASHFHELPNVPPENILPGTRVWRLISLQYAA